MNCDFCNELVPIKTIYNHIYKINSRQVYDTTHFCLVPCLGQLREGHFLIFSKQHVNSTGVLDRSRIEELQILIDEVAEYLKNEYHMDTICFEHGVLDDDGCNGGCGISHMHIHLLPGTVSEFEKLLKDVVQDVGNTLSSVNNILDTTSYIANKETYVFLSKIGNQNKDDSYIITNPNNYFESQYMRKKIAAVFGKDVWNWKDINYPEEDFLNTFSKAKKYFAYT